jgi:hypothetical protein
MERSCFIKIYNFSKKSHIFDWLLGTDLLQMRVSKTLYNNGANTTLMASLSRQGMGEAFILEGAADAVTFGLYIEQILAPSLHPGQIVIMDNLSIYQCERVRQVIEAKGCQLLFLPVYSPNLSPIEEGFSKLKASPTSCCQNAPGLGQGTWLAHRGADVLVEREEVGWIIRVLERDQPFVVDAIGCPHPLFSLVAQEVDVDATARKR